jgi:hypothetical protein
MRRLFWSAILAAGITFPCSADTVAFGYFDNVSGNLEYEFLRTVLPNSLSSALAAEYDFDVIKPSDVDAILISNDFGTMNRLRTPAEIRDLGRKIKKADYIVTGSFRPKDENTIEISVGIHDLSGNENLSFMVTGPFSTTGTTSTEVFNLVDGLTDSFNSFITRDHLYQDADVYEKSSVAFITNLGPEEMNSLYRPFMESGYSIVPLQLCETENHLSDDILTYKLKYLAVKKTAFDGKDSDTPQMFYYSPAIGRPMLMYQDTMKKMTVQYYLKFPEQTAQSLKRLNDACRSNIDYLFLLIFRPDRKETMIRVFDCRRFDQKLIWMQDRIGGAGTEPDRVTDVAKNIISNSIREKKAQKTK